MELQLPISSVSLISANTFLNCGFYDKCIELRINKRSIPKSITKRADLEKLLVKYLSKFPDFNLLLEGESALYFKNVLAVFSDVTDPCLIGGEMSFGKYIVSIECRMDIVICLDTITGKLYIISFEHNLLF